MVGWVYLVQEGKNRMVLLVPRDHFLVARLVLQAHFQEARALLVFVFDHGVAAQVADIWAYFSPGEGK